MVVHGEDFTVGGYNGDLDWFCNKIRERFDVEVWARLGGGKDDDKEVRIWNRIVEWVNGQGLWYEPDQRHAEITIRKLGLQGESKSVVTPGVEEKGEE